MASFIFFLPKILLMILSLALMLFFIQLICLKEAEAKHAIIQQFMVPGHQNNPGQIPATVTLTTQLLHVTD